MRSTSRKPAAIAAVLVFAAALSACAPQSQVARGQYLVSLAGCSDCHTPGGFSPHPDMSRYLAGSDVEFSLPGLGVFTPPNLTPDAKTGLGSWTLDQIATAFTTGVTPSGRILAPAMPWSDYAHLTRADALAIAAYLKSLPAVSNPIPGPAAPRPEPPGTVQAIVKRTP
jgi:mono/diheme cytochrome c family protein